MYTYTRVAMSTTHSLGFLASGVKVHGLRDRIVLNGHRCDRMAIAFNRLGIHHIALMQ